MVEIMDVSDMSVRKGENNFDVPTYYNGSQMR